MTHTLPDLGYGYDALEPFIDAKTMEIHHSKHHQAYINKLNAALEKHSELQGKDVDELVKDLNSIPEDIKGAVRNHGGGHSNHTLWWTLLKKDTELKGEISEAINKKFGSFDKFKEEFTNKAVTVFGSGWCWLVVDNGELEIMQTANQDTPLSQGKTPVLGIDMWEHSYYLKHANKRPDYLNDWWNVVNWDKVEELYKKVLG